MMRVFEGKQAILPGSKRLLAALLIAGIYGCSTNKTAQLYRAEKAFAKSERLQRTILINPAIAGADLYQDAVRSYQSVIEEFGPRVGEVPGVAGIVKTSLTRLAELYIMQDKLTAAIETYESIVGRFPDDTSLVVASYLAKGMCHERLFDAEGAIHAYEQVLRLDDAMGSPDSVDLHILQLPLHLARLRKMGADNGQARMSYVSATRYYEHLAGQWPDTHTGFLAMEHLAMTYADQKEWRDSIDILQELQDRFPDHPQAPQVRMAIGNLYVNALGEAGRGLRVYEQILERYPDWEGLAQVHLAIADAQLRLGRAADALVRYRSILESYSSSAPICARAQLGVAQTYEVRRAWERAMNEYRWLADNYPTTPEGTYAPIYIAQWYERNGNERLAEAAYENAMQRYASLAQKYPRSRLALLAQQYMVFVYTKQERWRSAINMLQAIQRHASNSSAAIASYLIIGSIYEQLGDLSRASQAYTEVVERYPSSPAASEAQRKLSSLEKRGKPDSRKESPEAVILHRPVDVDGSALRLAWSENADYDFACYRLFRSVTPRVDTSATLIATIQNPTDAAFQDSQVEPGTLYYYRVFSFDSQGTATGSNVVSGRTVPTSPLEAVDLDVEDVEYANLVLRWSASRVTDFSFYKIFRSREPGVSLSSRLVSFFTNPSVTSCRDAGLSENTTYYYRVFVFDHSGRHARSNEVAVTTPPNAPPAPVRLRAELDHGTANVTLKWTPSLEDDFSMYRIYRSRTSPVPTTGIPTQIISDKLRTRWENRGVRNAKYYHYRVVVVDAGGLSAASNEVSVRIPTNME